MKDINKQAQISMKDMSRNKCPRWGAEGVQHRLGGRCAAQQITASDINAALL